VHRVIKAILGGGRYQLPALPTPGEAHVKLARRLAERVAAPQARTERARKPSAEQQAWEAAGLHCSANERRADEASRDVEAWLKCKYMREHLGEEFSGVVSAATGFGIFVTLDAMYVEGLVHITELGAEYFRFDEARQEWRGERTGIRYAIGTRVRVQVSRVDLDGRRIDFRLVQEGQTLPAHVARERPPEPASKARSGGKRTRSADEPAAGQGRRAALLSPLSSLKAAVKKAVAKASRKQGKKSRR